MKFNACCYVVSSFLQRKQKFFWKSGKLYKRKSFINELNLFKIQGVPINMGIQWPLLYSLRYMRHFFMNTFIAVLIFWYSWYVVYQGCIFKIDGDIAKFVQVSIYLINQNCPLSIFKLQERYTTLYKVRQTYSLGFFLLSLLYIKY